MFQSSRKSIKNIVRFKMSGFLLLIVLSLCLGAGSQALALNIVLNDVGGTMTAQQSTAFNEAADMWENLFTDNVTVRIDVGFGDLGENIIASAGSERATASYANIFSALQADSKSASDVTATANLQTGDFVQTIIDNLNHDIYSGPDAYIFSSSFGINSSMWVTRANLKALGLLSDDGSKDARITFSNSFLFDYDRSGGSIDTGTMDFVGIAAHEIGHALGFTSGVDIMDWFETDDSTEIWDISEYDWFSILDLYRYSEISVGYNALDWTYGTLGNQFFSIDGGNTNLGLFSTGSYNGNGWQASHWEDDLLLGLMDPTSSKGEFKWISALDIQAFDVIGWDLNTGQAAVPEPGTLLLMGVGLLGLAGCGRRRRKSIGR